MIALLNLVWETISPMIQTPKQRPWNLCDLPSRKIPPQSKSYPKTIVGASCIESPQFYTIPNYKLTKNSYDMIHRESQIRIHTISYINKPQLRYSWQPSSLWSSASNLQHYFLWFWWASCWCRPRRLRPRAARALPSWPTWMCVHPLWFQGQPTANQAPTAAVRSKLWKLTAFATLWGSLLAFPLSAISRPSLVVNTS